MEDEKLGFKFNIWKIPELNQMIIIILLSVIVLLLLNNWSLSRDLKSIREDLELITRTIISI